MKENWRKLNSFDYVKMRLEEDEEKEMPQTEEKAIPCVCVYVIFSHRMAEYFAFLLITSFAS
jgi:hypothetical protein